MMRLAKGGTGLSSPTSTMLGTMLGTVPGIAPGTASGNATGHEVADATVWVSGGTPAGCVR
jgi:hypothetical protein